jgi:hypothetical protein
MFRRKFLFEPLESRHLLAGDFPLTGSPWQNPGEPLDTNRDGMTAPNDFLIVVNAIRRNGMVELPTTLPRKNKKEQTG